MSVYLQNTHKELWAVLSWANPGSLSDWKSFERHYVDPLKYGQKRDCTEIQLAKVSPLDVLTIPCSLNI